GQRLLAVPGVASVAQVIGRSTLSEDTWGAERSELMVQLTPDADTIKTTATLRERVREIRGFAFDLKQFLNERIEELLEGTGAELVVRLRGPDLLGLEEGALAVAERVASVPGAIDVQAAGALTAPGIRIRPRRADLLRLGLPATAVSHALRAALGGLPAGRLVENGRQADVVVRLESEEVTDPGRLGRLPIAAGGGRLILLDEVADIDVGPLRTAIAHEDGTRTIVVRLDA